MFCDIWITENFSLIFGMTQCKKKCYVGCWKLLNMLGINKIYVAKV